MFYMNCLSPECAGPLVVDQEGYAEVHARCGVCQLRHVRDRNGNWSVFGPLWVIMRNEDLGLRGVASAVWFDTPLSIRIEFQIGGALRVVRRSDLVALRPVVAPS